MALSEFEIRRIEKMVDRLIAERRPPAALRAEVDLFYRLEDQSVMLGEKRRLMDGSYGERLFAKATWVRSQKVWKIYWQRADLRWHGYKPLASVAQIEDFCAAVSDDPYGCFWG